MPVSIVVGGQFGSEGKGKVTLHLAQRERVAAAVRVGGPNSGHTAIGPKGDASVLRQLPTPALLHEPVSIIPAGAYVDAAVLQKEIASVGLEPDGLAIDPNAVLVTLRAKEEERQAHLGSAIGSTESGTGAAVFHRIQRDGGVTFAAQVPELSSWVRPTIPLMMQFLRRGERIVIEGTQGFGLSVLHGPHYPFATSRDTTAAAALSETGLSPLDVDEVVLVLRAFPIRVGGNSGPLEGEVTWQAITAAGGHDHQIEEFTSVTGRVRRVAHFSPTIVSRALWANEPTRVVLNHLDYVDHVSCIRRGSTERTEAFVRAVERLVDRRVDWLGYGPDVIEEKHVREGRHVKASP